MNFWKKNNNLAHPQNDKKVTYNLQGGYFLTICGAEFKPGIFTGFFIFFLPIPHPYIFALSGKIDFFFYLT